MVPDQGIRANSDRFKYVQNLLQKLREELKDEPEFGVRRVAGAPVTTTRYARGAIPRR